ncbi:response regulator [Arthrobacter sp. 92]|jgi:DNA-binding NarL/FixJ family response regulator|uniref:response regulator n=1 Tax=Arthrobacter sp. 92 TaxID=3418175 RepID=UPI0006A923D4|nr:transcriptional regulatory protein DevR (DosR) [Arthrobacter sp. Hiyo6]
MTPDARPTEASTHGVSQGLPPAVRIFILESNELVRSSLHESLEHDGFDVVGSSATAEDMVSRIAALNVDVALLSAGADSSHGAHVCHGVRSADPSVKCIILETFEDAGARREAELAGASGFVLKRLRGMGLVPTILSVLENGA